MTAPAAPAAKPPTALSAPAFYGVMAVLLLTEILGAFENNLILSAMPTLVRRFKDVTSVGWLVTIYSLGAAATAAIGGRLGDMFGRRRMLIVVVGICGLGSLVSALSSGLGGIIVGRALQGASGAILPLCYGITRQLAPPGRTPIWIGLLTGGYTFSAAAAYIIGGMLSDSGDWQIIFYLTGATAFVSIPLLLFCVPALPGQGASGRIDVLGAVLFAPAVALMLYALTQASKVGWAHGDILGVFGAGAALLAFWAWYELRVAEPLFDLRLLKRPKIALGNICGCLASFGVMQLPLVVLMFMQQPKMEGAGLGVSATLAGFLKLPSNIAAPVAAVIGGWICARYSSRWSVLVGGLVGALGWGLLIPLHDTIPQVVVVSMVCAFGSSVLLSALPNTVLEDAPMDRSSEATGMLAVTRGMATAVGVQVITILLAGSHIVDPKTGGKMPSEGAYNLTFAVIAATSLACGLLAMAAKGRAKAPAPAIAAAE